MDDQLAQPPPTLGQAIDFELDAIRREQAEQRAVNDLLQRVAVARHWVTEDDIRKVERAANRETYSKPRGDSLDDPDQWRGTG